MGLLGAAEPVYAGFGPTLLAEHARRRLGVRVSPETIHYDATSRLQMELLGRERPPAVPPPAKPRAGPLARTPQDHRRLSDDGPTAT